MAHKIEALMNKAIAAGNNWGGGNTTVTHENGVAKVTLHGNKIAEIGENFVTLFDGGWQTATTKSRLNAILAENGCGDERVFQKDHQWFISHDGKVEEFHSGITLR